MTEENYRKWDIIAKVLITPITLMLTLSWGIFQYNKEQKNLLEKEQEMRTLALIQKKEALYNETVSVVSSIANGDFGQPQVYETRIKRFWELYWGELASVESREIEALMVQFGQQQANKQADLSDLQQISIQIAHRTRFEIDSLYKAAVRQ